MASEPAAAAPSLPPSEVEWEDLLMLVELMPRALRHALEDAGAAGAAVREELAALVRREEVLGAWLERCAAPGASRGTENAANPGQNGSWAEIRPLAERFVSLRARNFAMVQRRGLEVWEWTGELGDEGVVSAYQALRWAVARDVAALAAIRKAARREEASAC